MHKALAMCCILMLTACQTDTAVKVGRDAAVSDYVACLHKAAHALDDYKSDPSIIGVKVAEQCTEQYHATTDGQANAVAMYNDKVESQEVASATAVVLDERQAPRASADP